jgi:hypothetical protein
VSIEAVWIPGWSYYSTWGHDDLTPPHYYAQLYRDDDPSRGDDPPTVWIQRITTLEDLADRIGEATGMPAAEVLAMMKAAPGSPEEAAFAERAQPST